MFHMLRLMTLLMRWRRATVYAYYAYMYVFMVIDLRTDFGPLGS